jgi:hypothetical protein
MTTYTITEEALVAAAEPTIDAETAACIARHEREQAAFQAGIDADYQAMLARLEALKASYEDDEF